MQAPNPKRVITPEKDLMMNINGHPHCTQPKKPKLVMPPETESLPAPNPMGSRSLIEKQRRKVMKDHYSSLASSLHLTPQEKLPLPALLDRSLGYVKKLKEKVELLKGRRDGLREDLALAAVQVNEKCTSNIVEVGVVTGLNKGFILAQVLTILDEEGARVLSANYARLSDKIVYSITAEAFSPRIGIETSRVLQRLKVLSGVNTSTTVVSRPADHASKTRLHQLPTTLKQENIYQYHQTANF